MALRSAIDITKNWSGALNRLGFGFLAIVVITFAWNPRNFSALWPFIDEKFGLAIAPVIVMIIFLSMVLGSVVLTFGNFFFRYFRLGPVATSRRFSEYEKAKRAYLVGNTQNTLLAEILRDGTNKYEQAAGFFGLFWFFGLAELMSRVTKFVFNIESVPIESTLRILSLEYLAFFALSIFLMTLVWHSAANTITALDQLLENISLEENPLDSKLLPSEEN